MLSPVAESGVLAQGSLVQVAFPSQVSVSTSRRQYMSAPPTGLVLVR